LLSLEQAIMRLPMTQPSVKEIVHSLSKLTISTYKDGMDQLQHLVSALDYSDTGTLASELASAQNQFPHVPLPMFLQWFDGEHKEQLIESVRASIPGRMRNSYMLKNPALSLPRRLKAFPSGKARTEQALAYPGFESPIIIAGFHHSGTRLLAQLLHAADVFQVATAHTYEWRTIQLINSALLADWNDPEAVSNFSYEAQPLRIEKHDLAQRLSSYGFRGGDWCFKDPRNDATVSAWLMEFPAARLIHVVRDPLDVLGTLPHHYERFALGGGIPQDRIEYWCDLWKANYASVKRSLPHARPRITVNFEELVAQPDTVIASVCDVLGLAPPERLKTSFIQPGKVAAHAQWLASKRVSNDVMDTIAERLERERSELGYP